MPSSISSSEPAAAAGIKPPPERAVADLGYAGIVALLLFIVLMVAWEMWARSQWLTPAYRNASGLWAEQRRKVDQEAGDGWVLIGSSRVLFDFQLPVWEQLDGRRPLQLALEGSSPLTVMEGLAEDQDFTGKLIVGVSPGLFFSGFAYRQDAIDRYFKESPAQWLGQRISLLLEPLLAFYDADYALPVILDRLPWPQREGAEWSSDVRKLSNMERDRNTRMWARVEQDPEYQALTRQIWAEGWTPVAERGEEFMAGLLERREQQIERAVAATGTLKERGVTVIFVRLPVSGHYAKSEPDAHPRAEAWDLLIERSGAIGYHFEDHPEMQGYELPEWSHMSASEADRFTVAFYQLLQREHPELFDAEARKH